MEVYISKTSYKLIVKTYYNYEFWEEIFVSNEGYLSMLLDQQELTNFQKDNLRNLREKIETQIKDEIGGSPRVYYGGSYAKNTMIQAAYDLDIVFYWPSGFSYRIEDLSTEVGASLQRHWTYVYAKRVGWELPFEGDFHIDIIPGKTSSNDQSYAYLFNRDTGGRFQTSIEFQVNYVIQSDRRDAIRLMKLWKTRKKVPIKTFILEQLVIEGCKYIPRNDLEKQLNATLTYIRDNILTCRLYDPANTNNVISDDITNEEKYRVRNLAEDALQARSWAAVFS